MNAWAIAPEQEAQLAQRMNALQVREADFEESFVRSGGPGGQNVNKTSTCVLLRHRPSGLQVKCQTKLHQGRNRFLARWRLLDRLESMRRARFRECRARPARKGAPTEPSPQPCRQETDAG